MGPHLFVIGISGLVLGGPRPSKGHLWVPGIPLIREMIRLQERRRGILSVATAADFRFGTCDFGLTAALGLWRSSTNLGFLAAMLLGECVIVLVFGASI